MRDVSGESGEFWLKWDLFFYELLSFLDLRSHMLLFLVLHPRPLLGWIPDERIWPHLHHSAHTSPASCCSWATGTYFFFTFVPNALLLCLQVSAQPYLPLYSGLCSNVTVTEVPPLTVLLHISHRLAHIIHHLPCFKLLFFSWTSSPSDIIICMCHKYF